MATPGTLADARETFAAAGVEFPTGELTFATDVGQGRKYDAEGRLVVISDPTGAYDNGAWTKGYTVTNGVKTWWVSEKELSTDTRTVEEITQPAPGG